MIRIAICDDEPNIAKNIAEKTKIHADNLGIPILITVYNSGREFLSKYHIGDYDVIFLDIDMPELSGDALSAELVKIDPALLLVYVTNYCNDEVYTMLKYMPIGFLRKPFFENEIDSMLGVLKEKIVNVHRIYSIQSGRQVVKIPLKDIMYIESDRNYAYFYMNSSLSDDTKNNGNRNEIVKTRKKMDIIESELEQYGFIRIHASFLVNYRWIYSIHKNKIVLDDGETLPISRSRETYVEQKFMYFSRG
ncbi:MAG: LytTR family DNA-binding domain-containing protein [Ruminococcus sp.]|nr:LytTR family DNA-binding domain-containing protein [Ruminococcus sp.]